MPSLQEQQAELRQLLNEANATMDKAKELFRAARDVSDNILNAYHATVPGVIEELQANGGPTVARRRRTQLTGELVMPNNEDVIDLAVATGKPVPVDKEFKRACGNCGKPGHRSTTCTEPSKTANVPMGKRTCSICRKPGHRASTCPNRRTKDDGE